MKKPRKERGTVPPNVTPLVAVLLLLIANRQALVLTLGPACG